MSEKQQADPGAGNALIDAIVHGPSGSSSSGSSTETKADPGAGNALIDAIVHGPDKK